MHLNALALKFNANANICKALDGSLISEWYCIFLQVWCISEVLKAELT